MLATDVVNGATLPSQSQLAKAARDGRTVSLKLIQELRETNREKLAALRAQMPGAQVALANAILSGSNKDLDAVAKLGAQIGLAEDADEALALAEILATLRDLEAEQKQLLVERERLAKDRDTLQAGHDSLNQPSFTVERVEKLREIASHIHGVRSAIDDIDQQAQRIGDRSVELEGQLKSFAVTAAIWERK